MKAKLMRSIASGWDSSGSGPVAGVGGIGEGVNCWTKETKSMAWLDPKRKDDQHPTEPKDAPGNRRIIKTGRTLEIINQAAQQGYRPLVKPVQPSPDVHYQVAVFQDPENGTIAISADVRQRYRGSIQGEMVMEYILYYPYHFPSPFAAYLVPQDLAIGEEVWLEDVIEDLVAVWGNQGYHPRLQAAPAIWNGADFVIQFDPQRDAQRWIG
jgi:hypothetical protein